MAPSYFCNNFVKPSIFTNFLRTCTPLNSEQNDDKSSHTKPSILLEGYLSNALWNTAHVNMYITNVAQLCNCKVVVIVSNVLGLSETSYKAKILAIHHQCNSQTLKQMFKVSASGPNTCPQPYSPLINHFINDRLLDAWPTVNQTLPQLNNVSVCQWNWSCRTVHISVFHRLKVWAVRHEIGCYEVQHFATKQLHFPTHCAPAHTCLKLVPCFTFYKTCEIPQMIENLP